MIALPAKPRHIHGGLLLPLQSNHPPKGRLDRGALGGVPCRGHRFGQRLLIDLNPGSHACSVSQAEIPPMRSSRDVAFSHRAMIPLSLPTPHALYTDDDGVA
jgi:hypothetical protein